jgi:type III secretion protein N (ATPase)
VDLDALRAELRGVSPAEATGRVHGVKGLSITATLPGARIGDVVIVRRRGGPLLAEVVGFDDGVIVAMPLGDTTGIGTDDVVESTGAPLEIRTGEGLLGRVLDGLGRPLDGRPLPQGELVPVDRAAPPPLGRQLVDAPLATGIRAIDGLLTLGIGQRIGLFSGSGVGKSTILGSLARNAAADVVVVALIGERGREAKELIEHSLAPALARSVVVVATSDAPAVERLRAAQVATTVAESFRDVGRRVLLLVDSITRVARAQREVGLAAGEPPARRGYPPSVFALLPRLLERSGPGETGSITAIYAVLVEGDDLDEPITDEVRGILDGHIVLSRSLAQQHHYPAIDVPASVSRTMTKVASAEHRRAAAEVRALIALAEEKRDLIALGAYRSGSDAAVDRALAAQDELRRFLRQPPEDVAPFDATVQSLTRIAKRFSGT